MVVSSVGAPAKSKTSWGDLGRAACSDLEPGWMPRVTIADVAMRAGVSKTAVSFAFNNPERLGQATLERVLGVAHDLGYTPHPAARALSMRRSGTIGVLIPQRLSAVFANPFVTSRSLGRPEAAARQRRGRVPRDLAGIVLPQPRAQVNSTPTAARRMAGYRTAIQDAGAPPLHMVTAGISVAAGARAFEALPESKRRATARAGVSGMAADRGVVAAPPGGAPVAGDPVPGGRLR